MQPKLFVPEGWKLVIPHQDFTKGVYEDMQGVQYHPHFYFNGASYVWGWLQVQSFSSGPPFVVESSHG